MPACPKIAGDANMEPLTKNLCSFYDSETHAAASIYYDAIHGYDLANVPANREVARPCSSTTCSPTKGIEVEVKP